MIYNVFSGTLNPTHSVTHGLIVEEVIDGERLVYVFRCVKVEQAQ